MSKHSAPNPTTLEKASLQHSRERSGTRNKQSESYSYSHQYGPHAVHTAASPTTRHEKQPRHSKVKQLNPVDKLHSFNTTMHHTYRQLSATERSFSKFIHQPTVETMSELASKTIARPSGIVGASLAASIGLLLVYCTARFAGFQLSGFEVIFLVLLGFAVGLFVEWLVKAVYSLFTSRAP